MLPFDDRLPTDSTNGDLAIRDWTPLPFYPPSAPDPTGQRRDATLRRWPPPVAADQTIADPDGAPPVAADAGEEAGGPLVIQSGATFQAPDLDGFGSPVKNGVVDDGAYSPLVIQSGTTFRVPELAPGFHALEDCDIPEDRSPLLIKSGATFPAPDLDDAVDGKVVADVEETDVEELEGPWAPHRVWRWSLNAVVVLVPAVLIISLILATDPPAPRAAPDVAPKYAPAVHGSLFPVKQAAGAEAAAEPYAPLPRSVPTATADERGTASRKVTRPDNRRVADLVTSAQRSARQRRWVRARSRAAAALRISPRNRRARAIQRLAERKLRQRHRHLTDARRALSRGQWARARAHAAAALRVDPRDRRAKKLKQLAERRLRRRPHG